MMKNYLASSLIAVCVFVVGCSDDNVHDSDGGPVLSDAVSPPATPGIGGSVYDTIVVRSTQFSTLRKAIDLAGLANMLDDEDKNFTVFAPDDAAFQALNTGAAPTALDVLMADTDALIRLLQFHTVNGSFDEVTLDTAAAVGVTLPTLIDGEFLTVTTDSTSIAGLAIDGVAISTTDLVLEVPENETTSGIVHTIVEVLKGPEAIGIPAQATEFGASTGSVDQYR